MENSTPSAPPAASTEDRTVAILAYVTWVGLVIAIVMHSSKKTQVGAFHLRQSLGLWIAGTVICVGLAITVVGAVLIPFVGLGLFIFAIMGLINAINGQMKPVPLVGAMFQKWFAGAFN
jgi:uncharacterized membrane protein